MLFKNHWPGHLPGLISEDMWEVKKQKMERLVESKEGSVRGDMQI